MILTVDLKILEIVFELLMYFALCGMIICITLLLLYGIAWILLKLSERFKCLEPMAFEFSDGLKIITESFLKYV